MSKGKKPTPNTHLGDVEWSSDVFWGNMLWLCQDMLGLREAKDKDERFLNPEKCTISGLWDFFDEVELPNGTLGLELFVDTIYHTTDLCTIETKFPLGEPVSDQAFLNLIEDFKEYVRTLPLAQAREGALIVNPDDSSYYEESNQEWLKHASEHSAAFRTEVEATAAQLQNEAIDWNSSDPDDEDIPF